jgi:hypothetical protein
MSLTTIDTLLVRQGEELALFALWDRLLDAFREREGFLSGTLLRALAHEHLPALAPFSHVSMLTFTETVEFADILADGEIKGRIADLRRVCLLTPGVFIPVRRLQGNITLQHVALH